MKNVFARDDAGNVKHKKPCQTPGCDYPNYHVCLVGKPDSFPDILGSEQKRKGAAKGRTLSPRTESHREAIAQSQRERWARIREKNASRNKAIVERYAEGDISVRGLMAEFNLGHRVISNVLKEAEAAGTITVRKQGQTLRYGPVSVGA